MKAVSGLKIEDVKLGTGPLAERGDIASIEWCGWLNQGHEFGSGRQSVQIGGRNVIAGLEYGLIGMGVGGVRKLRVSPHFGYRDQSVPGIPPNAVLNFEINLLWLDHSNARQPLSGKEPATDA